MTNHVIQNSSKRRKVTAAVAQEIAKEDSDDVMAGKDVCNVIEHQINQHKQMTNSSALHKLGETIRNTLFEISEIQEQNHDRRHKELLQILTKISQQDTVTNCEDSNVKINLNSGILHNDQLPNENSDAQSHLEKDSITSDPDRSNSLYKESYNETDKMHLDCSVEAKDDTSENFTKLPRKSQQKKAKTITAVKQGEKIELEKMRAHMLELQRKKMEDRERKKRGVSQT